ncbi:sirohydrochlorin chelatase [Streptomyces sp. NRRL WC-3742]|uniref:sirohydrochlorin chelatase n=1 Tax=Streptomyces sp. NRRL WC-3742 TaxID=1463934 RepID=UPI00068C6CCD|nr:CbiX/SirB N-terminal domain-containing protein [Streptomyces sp. NRRL WC-3742]
MTLLAVGHGSRDPRALAATRALVRLVRSMRPELDIRLCFLDHAEPSLSRTLAQLDGPRPVVVPLLLSTGYHVKVDLAATGLPLARALGPHPLLAEALAHRLAEAGAPSHAPVVLAGAGSSDPAARADTARTADLLAARLGRPVTPAYLSGHGPTPHQALAAHRAAAHPETALATYLLAPGHFARRAADTPATWTSAPLGAHPALARLVLHRYDEARARALLPAAA